MKSKSGNSLRSVLAHIVLIVLSFMCLFFFYILIINATRSHAELQKGFSALPGTHLLENLKNVANDGSFPMFRGIINSICISTACAGLCTYFSALTAYGLYAYEFKTRKEKIGGISCNGRPTSCGDQLAKACREAYEASKQA